MFSLKKVLLLLSFVLVSFWACLADAPGFAWFRESMYTNNWDWASTFDFRSQINPTGNLKNNVRNLFYPTSWGRIWVVLRNIWVWIFILFLIRSWFLLLFSADKDADLKKSKLNFVYLLYWAFLFFWVVWILGSALQVGSFQWTQWQFWLVNTFQNNLLLQILWFLKAWAFFIAIIMIIYYGYQIISAFEQEDKIKNARKWVLNVAIALIFIKVIDYIYYIAQTPNFKNQASELFVSFSRVMWFTLWWVMVLSVFYAGSLLIGSAGHEDKWKKAKTIITSVFLVSVIVMLFLLIAHQVISELA